MHPAFSVIFFTTLSGAGYGLLFWLGLHYAWQPLPLSREYALTLLGLSLLLFSIGLLLSLGHLGKPLRAWRAFSQWRSSWLSREGVAAVVTYVPALWLAWIIWTGNFDSASQVAGLLCALMAVVTVICTAMIYASLRTVPAWRRWPVVPGYLLFAAITGLAWLWCLLGLTGWQPSAAAQQGFVAGILLLAVLKTIYWRLLDRPATHSALSTNDAVGLPNGQRLRQIEAPHTEANYLTREMVFVLARRHARRLRRIALVLIALVPLMCLLLAAQWPAWRWAAGVVIVLSLQLGAVVERWLFFAQARHVVSLFYGGPPLDSPDTAARAGKPQV